MSTKHVYGVVAASLVGLASGNATGGTAFDVLSQFHQPQAYFSDLLSPMAYPQPTTILSKNQPVLKTNNPDWSWIQPRATGETYGQAFFLDQNQGWVTILGGTGLLVTKNAGKTWSRQSFGPYYGFMDVFFSDPQHGWAVGNGSNNFDIDNDTTVIWATSDGGINWYEQYHQTDPQGGGLAVVQFANDAVGYTFGRNGLALKTVSGGLSWKPLTLPQEVLDAKINLLDAKVLSPDVVWVIGSRPGNSSNEIPSVNYVIKTLDGGDTWFAYQIEAGKYDELAKIEAFGDIAWVAGQSIRIYRTVDGGSGWEAFEIDQPTIQPVVDIDFTNPYEGWIALRDGRVMSTVDSGRNWGLRSVMPQGRPESLVFADALHGWVFCNHGMMYTTADGGLTWSFASSDNDNTLNAASFRGKQGWVVGEAGTILKTQDGGKNWKTQQSNFKGMLNAVSFYNSTHGVTVGDGGTALWTTNSGKKWTSRSTGGSIKFNGVAMVDKTAAWVTAEEEDSLLRTFDGGVTWQSPTLPVSGYYLSSPFFFDKDHGWVIGNSEKEDQDGVLLRTTDGGNTWSAVNPKFLDVEGVDKNVFLSVFFTSPEEGWMVGGYLYGDDTVGGVMHTTDGGVTWTRQMADKTPVWNFNLVRFSDKNNGIVTGPFSNSNWITRDGGNTWEPRIAFHTGMNLITDIAFADKKTAIAVGSGGAIMRSTNGGGTTGPYKPQFDASLAKIR